MSIIWHNVRAWVDVIHPHNVWLSSTLEPMWPSELHYYRYIKQYDCHRLVQNIICFAVRIGGGGGVNGDHRKNRIVNYINFSIFILVLIYRIVILGPIDLPFICGSRNRFKPTYFVSFSFCLWYPPFPFNLFPLPPPPPPSQELTLNYYLNPFNSPLSANCPWHPPQKKKPSPPPPVFFYVHLTYHSGRTFSVLFCVFFQSQITKTSTFLLKFPKNSKNL